MRSMTNTRKLTLAAGVLYIVTFVASIPTLVLKQPVIDHLDFVLGHGDATPVLWGGLLDFVCAIAGIGTAVALYPVVRRFSSTSAIGFVTTRTLEAGILVVGVISLLSVVTLRNDVVGSSTTALTTTSQSLVAMHNWSFLLGPGFMASFNALVLATAMYRFRLVPRFIPIMGFIGAPLLLASSLATFFGGHGQVSDTATLFALPIAAWEFSLGIHMMFKGLRHSNPAGAPVAAPALAA
jgi:hypothetical protein